uniref:ATP-dependent zinc metalloprotease FtsH n=4 Tax=Apple proliferation phytoplasma TaxID=37692 RepID=G0LXY1_APPPP|nr:HflB protein [Candidatus Phytoplasma mali]
MKYKKKNILFITTIIVIYLAFLFNWLEIGIFKPKGESISESEMLSKISRKDISESVRYSVYKTMFLKDKPFDIRNVYQIELTTHNNEKFHAEIIKNTKEELSFELLPRNKISYQYEFRPFSWLLSIFSILLNFIHVLSSLVFTIYIFLAIHRESGKLNSKSLITSKQKSLFTFKDVAGNTEEKEEMTELIDFLKQPQKYETIGAAIPRGVLLEGPPGTGKTLLAKALAGEANVPFYAVSGSEFVEMYVGVGASRVRKLFKEAKLNAPCVLFIDEIDVLGGKRGGNYSGGNQEKDQTLNQLLTEMDGFTPSQGIIVIGATNRADMLDAALLRPGRFDRKILVNLPDIKSRAEILKLHAQNKKLSPDINFHQLAQQTPGMSGAQLAAVLNEASILTVRNHKDFITMTELSEALDRVLMGPAKKSIKYDLEERRMVAYHEAGHAVIGIKLKHAQKVQKITIIPRGNAGGYNLMMPEKETFFSSRKRMLAQIQSFLGGRVAEELVFDDISSGAFDDFRQATKIARLMVTKYGMSDLGVSQDSEFSDKKLIDTAIKKIISECYQQVQIIIKENKDLLDQIAHLLLEQETITKEEIEKLVVNTKK